MFRPFTLLLLLCLGGVLSAQSPIEYLQTNYEKIGLTVDDVTELRITDDYASPNGIQHVYVQQYFRGIPIYSAQAALHYRGAELVYQTNRMEKGLGTESPVSTPTLSAADAVWQASLPLDVPSQGRPVPTRQEDGRTYFQWDEVSAEPIFAELIFFPIEGRRQLCWQVALDQINSADVWRIHVNALNGEIVNRFNRVIYCDFGVPTSSTSSPHIHGADCKKEVDEKPEAVDFHTKALSSLVDEGSSYRVFPFGLESPLYGDRIIVENPADSVASPYGWHDTDGTPGAEHTITRGNNVYAYADRDEDNQADMEDLVDGGDSLTFDFYYEDNADPDTLLPAAITQLFYMNNRMHDFAYAHGFNEEAGNFQRNNYGRGGEGNDAILAEAQDGSGTNNAFFFFAPEGAPGRMEMFLWLSSGTNSITVDAPSSLAGALSVGGASYGPTSWDAPITGNLAVAIDETEQPTLVCGSVANPDEINGSIALIRRGDCFFEEKTLNAQAAGAIAVIICNPENDLFTMGGGVDDDEPTIPSVMLRESDCAPLRVAIAAGDSVIITLPANAQRPPLDADFDNGIIGHEYGHGISTRLIGGPANVECTRNQEQMGEGWSDFFGLAISPINGATEMPNGTEPRGIGNFVTGNIPSGGGIRRLPYSTDMDVNDHTYDAIITSGTPHPLGEIWGTTLWDMYWALVDEYGFDEDLINGTGGNNIAVQLVIEGLKYTSCNPGMVDGRNGILVADELLFEGRNTCLIWEVFARRGLGYLATQGSSNEINDGRENFEVQPNCFKTVKLKKTSDVDVIVAGEPVTFTITVTNDKLEDAKGITVTDEIPEGMVFDPNSVNGIEGFVIGDGTVTFNVGTLPADEQEIFSYQVTTSPEFRSVGSYFDGAELGDDEWEIFPLNGEGSVIWQQTEEEVYDGEFAWFVENVEEENDQVLQTLDPLELIGDQPAVRFFTKYDIEAGWDGGIVEMSTDGTNWTNVGNDRFLRGGYRGEVAPSAFDASVTDFNAYWGDSDGYFDAYLDFSDMAGSSVYLRWRFGSDEAVANVGWWVDNIEVLDLFRYTPKASLTSEDNDVAEAELPEGGVIVDTDIDTDVTDPVLGETRVSVFPNPANDFVHVAVETDRPGDLTVQLLSLDGRVLQEKRLELNGGLERTQLPLANLPSGMYLVQLIGADRIHTEKLTVN